MDKYYVYRPLLDLIGYTEGTDEKRGYNETLAYGKFTGGDVDLVSMTLAQIDALQTKMLKHPLNTWNSSAIGRYQIVRTTLRTIKETLKLSDSLKFDRDMQDRCGCYLLGVRGIDKYLSGRLAEDTLINNLAQEWASLPTTKDKGYYSGQNARVKSPRVREVLAQVRARHKQGQPEKIVEVPKPVVPEAVETEVKKKFNLFAWIGSLLGGGGGLGIAAFAGFDWKALAVLMFGAALFFGLGLLFRHWLVKAIREIKEAIE